MSSVDGTLIMSKQRSTHLQAYDYHLSLITYDLDIINIQITQGYIAHMACIYSMPEHAVMLKSMRYYCKHSLIFELMFSDLLDINLHRVHILKASFMGDTLPHLLLNTNRSFATENTSICFAITLYLKCVKWTICIFVMMLICFLRYCSNESNLISGFLNVLSLVTHS